MLTHDARDTTALMMFYSFLPLPLLLDLVSRISLFSVERLMSVVAAPKKRDFLNESNS